MNFILFFISYFLILLSIIGYGYFFRALIGKNHNELEIGYIGLYGIFFITIYSYFSHLFVEHSKTHNTIILFIGLLLFTYYFIQKTHDKFFKKDLILLIVIFCILFTSLLVEKNHDDFSYYHFAYTYNLTQEPTHFGLGKFNHGFRTPSSIFYINSLFYLPFVNYYLFNFAQVFIMGFANIIFFKNISFHKQLEKNYQNNNNLTNILSLLCLIFINIFFIGYQNMEQIDQLKF
jgi:hypothetical protein